MVDHYHQCFLLARRMGGHLFFVSGQLLRGVSIFNSLVLITLYNYTEFTWIFFNSTQNVIKHYKYITGTGYPCIRISVGSIWQNAAVFFLWIRFGHNYQHSVFTFRSALNIFRESATGTMYMYRFSCLRTGHFYTHLNTIVLNFPISTNKLTQD